MVLMKDKVQEYPQDERKLGADSEEKTWNKPRLEEFTRIFPDRLKVWEMPF